MDPYPEQNPQPSQNEPAPVPTPEPTQSFSPVAEPTPVQQPSYEAAPASQPAAAPVTPQVPQQPATPYTTPYAAAPVPPTIQPASNPGKTLGIVGLVLAFFGLSLVGLILSIMSRAKSKKAHASHLLGTIGIVVNSVAIVASVLVIGAITMLAYAGIQNRAATEDAKNVAAKLVKKTGDYYYAATPPSLPASLADFSKYPETTLDGVASSTVSISDTAPASKHVVNYKKCSDTGAQISYYDSTNSTVAIYPVGDATMTPC